jgi:hypothetical protein
MTEKQQRVNELITRVEQFQAAMRWGDERFANHWRRYLGSPKSWTHRLRARNWPEIGKAIDKWEKKLTAFVTEIEVGATSQEFFDALPIYAYGVTVFNLLGGQRNDRRCAWLIAPTGCGKTWTMTKLAADHKDESVYLHIVPGMKDSLARIACALATAVGTPEKTGGAATFEEVLKHLKGSPLTLLVDDVHEGGVMMLKLLKCIIDESRSRLILGSYPTGYSRLIHASSDAMSEAQQLFGRSIKPIRTEWRDGLQPVDIAAFIAASTPLKGVVCQKLAERIVDPLRRGGNLRALADAVELAADNADEDGAEVSAYLLEGAVRQLFPERGDSKQEMR